MLPADQQNTLEKDSQFVNAAEYGSNEIVLNGEIGKYLGVKIIDTENTPKYAIGDAAPDGGSVWAVAGTRCIMAKANAAAALVWGIKPRLHIFDYPRELEQDFVLEMSYASSTIHNDALVFADVADA